MPSDARGVSYDSSVPNNFIPTEDADTLSLKRIDPYHVEFTQKRGGKVVMTGTRTISRDGKEMTIVTKGSDARGQTVNNVEVFERR